MAGSARLAAGAIAVLLLALSACAGISTRSPAVDLPRAYAPDEVPAALRGDYFRIMATGIGRTYHIHVRLPEGYDSGGPVRYPVVVILDGDSLFPLLAPAHLFLTNDESLPEAVLVGISYGGFDPAINKRNVDFSAPGPDARPGEAGAPEFLRFLKSQLLPELQLRYRVDPDRRILVGQSRAGYFVLWSALQDPDLFWASIASNASFQPTRESLYRQAVARPAGARYLALISGTRDTPERMRNARDWIQHWQQRGDRPWTLRHIVLEGGTHAASIGEAYRAAMVWLFLDRPSEADGVIGRAVP